MASKHELLQLKRAIAVRERYDRICVEIARQEYWERCGNAVSENMCNTNQRWRQTGYFPVFVVIDAMERSWDWFFEHSIDVSKLTNSAACRNAYTDARSAAAKVSVKCSIIASAVRNAFGSFHHRAGPASDMVMEMINETSELTKKKG